MILMRNCDDVLKSAFWSRADLHHSNGVETFIDQKFDALLVVPAIQSLDNQARN